MTDKTVLDKIDRLSDEMKTIKKEVVNYTSARFDLSGRQNLLSSEVEKQVFKILNSLHLLEKHKTLSFVSVFSEYCDLPITDASVRMAWYYFKGLVVKYKEEYNIVILDADWGKTFMLTQAKEYQLESVGSGFNVLKDGAYVLDCTGIPHVFRDEEHFLNYFNLLKDQGLDPWE